MNKEELNRVFEWMEPTKNQKESMFQNIMEENQTIKSKKHSGMNKVLKLVASFALVLSLGVTTAYASGVLDDILGYFSIEKDFVSWATSNELVTKGSDIEQANTQPSYPSYDEIYTYPTIEEALEKHDLNIAIPESKLITNHLYESSVKISNESYSTHTNFNTSYDLSVGTVELNVDCFEVSPNNNGVEIGISTSQHADKASKYTSNSGAEFTLLEANIDGTTETVANIMIHTDCNQTYLYAIKFTNASETNMEEILDSLDMSIHITK